MNQWNMGVGIVALCGAFLWGGVSASAEVAAAAGAGAGAVVDPAEVLGEYVHRPDDSYGWAVRQRLPLGACEVVELTLTSQTWRGLVWQHRLFVVIPEGVEADAEALLVVEGGSWKDQFAEALEDGQHDALPKEAVLLATFAQSLGSPIAILLNVPRQPIFEGRKEDAIIALTFDHYLESGETDWPLLLPMVKSAVRAMDALQAFAAEDMGVALNGFTVAGASKRGWTTWLTAAVDDRVRGLAPMVIDMLNLDEQFEHQLASYGEFSDRIHDYTDRDLPRRMSGESGEALRQIVDPYSYRERITQPKMLFLGTNDGYWTVDALNLYWDGLEGEKAVVYVPNADHDLSMDWKRVGGGLTALHRHVHEGVALPGLTWDYREQAGKGDARDAVELTVDPGGGATPGAGAVPGAGARVTLWTAEAPTRDFREAAWSARALALDDSGLAVARVEAPEQGYRAVFAETVYGHGTMPLYLSTTIRVLGPAGQ